MRNWWWLINRIAALTLPNGEHIHSNASWGMQMSHAQYLSDYARSFDGSSKCQSVISVCGCFEIRVEHELKK